MDHTRTIDVGAFRDNNLNSYVMYLHLKDGDYVTIHNSKTKAVEDIVFTAFGHCVISEKHVIRFSILDGKIIPFNNINNKQIKTDKKHHDFFAIEKELSQKLFNLRIDNPTIKLDDLVMLLETCDGV